MSNEVGSLSIQESSTVTDHSQPAETDLLDIEITNAETGETQAGTISRHNASAVESGKALSVVVLDSKGLERGIPASWISKGLKVPKGD